MPGRNTATKSHLQQYSVVSRNTIRMIIRQECFKTLKDFANNPCKYKKGAGSHGVYMWGFSLEQLDYQIPSQPGKFSPYYVGKVDKLNGCMYKRTHEHLASLIGGNFPIFDILSASSSPGIQIGSITGSYQLQYKRAGCVNLPNCKYGSLFYYPEGIHTTLHFNTDATLKNQIDWMIRHFCITYYIPVSYDKAQIAILEKYIGSLLPNRTIGKRYSSMGSFRVEVQDGNNGNITLNSYNDLFSASVRGTRNETCR